MKVAICQGTTILQVLTVTKALRLPNGKTLAGLPQTLPMTVSNDDEDYTIYRVILTGDRPLPHQKESYGIPVLNGDVVELPRISVDKEIESLRNQLLRSLSTLADAHENAGVMIGGKKIPINQESISKINTYRRLAEIDSGATAYTIRLSGGKRILVTATQIKNGGAVIDRFLDEVAKAEDAHINAITALATVPQIVNYDITTGWPANSALGQ